MKRVSTRSVNGSWAAIALVLSVAKPLVRADSWNFVTPVPNWRLGSPQPALIGFCSNIDSFATGAGISDRLSVGLLTRGVTTRISTEMPGPLGTDPGRMAMAPEPSSIALLLTALTVAAGLMWRARKPRTSVPAA